MTEAVLQDEEEPRPAARSRSSLLKRLADVVCLPSSRVNTFERAMTADLLVEMLKEAPREDRAKVARRLVQLVEIPNALLRLLLGDEVEVARPLLEQSNAIGDADLIACARVAKSDHRRLIARRREVSEVVTDALVASGELGAIEDMLRNPGAKISQPAIEAIVAASREATGLAPLLLKRPELRPSQAYVMFWWADADGRRVILQRFAVSRDVLQDAASDVFAMAAEEGWTDPSSRKALQFIERRQRNRAAIEKSPYDSLEDAVRASQAGLTRELSEEISYLAGVKPMTGAKILADPGGEPIAILCKATGLPKAAVRALWRGLRRPERDAEGNPTPGFERALLAFDMIAVDRAQTVLRYWNWALSSAMTPALLKAIQEGDVGQLDEFSVPQRAAMLAFAGEFDR